jgi:hypothetical protein
MTVQRVTCVTKSIPTTTGHKHIIEVGVMGEPKPLTVPQVYARMSQGVTFYTVSPSSGKVALVKEDECACGVATLRSHADAIPDNNLDNLTPCG